MATVQEKSCYVEWFIEKKSTTQVQQNFRRVYGGRDVPSRCDIKQWYDWFMETGSVVKVSRLGRPRVPKAQVETIREAFHNSPTKSTLCVTETSGTRLNHSQSTLQAS
jgi:hypothetical protein